MFPLWPMLRLEAVVPGVVELAPGVEELAPGVDELAPGVDERSEVVRLGSDRFPGVELPGVLRCQLELELESPISANTCGVSDMPPNCREVVPAWELLPGWVLVLPGWVLPGCVALGCVLPGCEVEVWPR